MATFPVNNCYFVAHQKEFTNRGVLPCYKLLPVKYTMHLKGNWVLQAIIYEWNKKRNVQYMFYGDIVMQN